jgi:signal peptidase II
MKFKYVFLIAWSTFAVALDQVTKLYIHTRFQLGESTTVIQNFFNITYVRNPGAAFGFLAESHPEFREIFFLVIPPIAMFIILAILRGVSDKDRWQIFALSSIFGGAIGNYIDRIRFRYVIDFLDFHLYEKYSWPAFNVADSAIVLGVMILIALMWFEKKTIANSVPTNV